MIRQADKGGAFVVWRTDLYIAEANRQLTDEQFCKKILSDATQSSQQEVKTFITTAIESNRLPPFATNLIVEHPRTSKFYLLPKIHKPGNPGRRLADRFREHRRDVINGRNDLPVPAHFEQPRESYTRRSEGCGFEGRPSQPRIPEEAGNAVDF